MTRAKTKEQIAVMKAFCEGKPIECRITQTEGWKENLSPGWYWSCCEYRVKVEPVVLYQVRAKKGTTFWAHPTADKNYATQSLADAESVSPGNYRIFTFREVTEENNQ